MSMSSATPTFVPPQRDKARLVDHPIKIDVNALSFFYDHNQALHDITIELRANLVTALIGPSGCGTSTFLRTLNRMNDVIPGTRVEGRVNIGGRDNYGADVDVAKLRRRVASSSACALRERSPWSRTSC
jgi:ABC-type phosphate transport system ATPase subunit